MKTIWIVSNAFAVVTTLVCMSYLWYACRRAERGSWPLISICVIGVTALISGLQFAYPELLAALRRDPDAVRSGELWRFVTALFVQPGGISQCIANGFLILAFVPAAERLYGKHVLVIYFASGLVGQIVNYLWDSGSGGSSTAIFGVMGSLLVYIIRNRKELLLPFAFIASAGLLTCIVMLLSRDGHGVGMMVGASVGSMLPLVRVIFRSKGTNTFPEPVAPPESIAG